MLPIDQFAALLKTMKGITLSGAAFDGALSSSNQSPIQNTPEGTAIFFSQQTAFSTGTAAFGVNSNGPVTMAVVELTGYDDNRPTQAPIQIAVNGAIVYQGDSPFPNADWGTFGILLRDSSVLRQGSNQITIRNMATQGRILEPPWFLIQSVTIHYR